MVTFLLLSACSWASCIVIANGYAVRAVNAYICIYATTQSQAAQANQHTHTKNTRLDPKRRFSNTHHGYVTRHSQSPLPPHPNDTRTANVLIRWVGECVRTAPRMSKNESKVEQRSESVANILRFHSCGRMLWLCCIHCCAIIY